MTAPLVLLHGFLGAPSAWDQVAELVREGEPATRVSRPWLPGHGPGAAPPPDTWEATVDAVAAMLPPMPAVIAGYSNGGRLALGLLARHPERVAALVLVSAHLGLVEPDERERRRRDDQVLAALGDARGIEALVAAHAARPVLASQGALPPEQRELLAARRRAHAPRSVAATLRATGLGSMPDLRDALRGAAARGVVVATLAGMDDPTYAGLCREAAVIALGEATVVAGCGHDLLLEAPDCVALVVLATLRTRRASAPLASPRPSLEQLAAGTPPSENVPIEQGAPS